jgi:acetoacetyl-[acyl-carrier protein] synthase
MAETTPARLAVIVGFGGYNAAGRASSHHAYRRMVIESLPIKDRQDTLAGLAVMMGLINFTEGNYRDDDDKVLSLSDIERRFSEQIFAGTLIRRIEKTFFDVDATYWQKNAMLTGANEEPIVLELRYRDLPEPIPSSWLIEKINDDRVRVTLPPQGVQIKWDSYRELPVKSAGQLPSGFNPGSLASDAVRSIGIEWQTIVNAVRPDQISVYASNVMSQLDGDGMGGLLQARLRGERVSAKQCPLGLNTMSADFVNAYILGSVGQTGAVTGACASFLYNLRAAVEDISLGACRVAVVGCAEAPILSEIIDGYSTMGALASEEKLCKLDGTEQADPRRTSRPFGENAGFTMAEASQYIVLMDDALVVELGAVAYGAVTDVFINADGFKKSISAPGPGNYITMAKAVASARAILGDESIQKRSMIQAHGSSTPQNRVTESMIFDQIAQVFHVKHWPVAAVKAYVGHSLAAASGEQLICSLGIFQYGIIPGIKTIDKVADDVIADRLQISTTDIKRTEPIDVVFLNSKGFGGNNATACLIAPHKVEQMLERRYGAKEMAGYRSKRERTQVAAHAYDQAALKGDFATIYQFGEGLIDEHQIKIEKDALHLPGFEQAIDLRFTNRFADMV